MTVQATTEKSFYRAAFEEFSEGERRRRGAPSWVERLRESALQRFEELGFPTTHEEDWK